jgi:hypothetical protein
MGPIPFANWRRGGREQDRVGVHAVSLARSKRSYQCSRAALTLLAGCTYEQEGPPEAHFEKFDTDMLQRMQSNGYADSPAGSLR